MASFEVVVAALLERPPALLHREQPARHLDHRRRPACRRECCAKRSASMVAEVMTTFRSGRRGSSCLQVAEQEVDVQAALVRLVDDHRVVGAQQRIGLRLGEQDAVGHQLDRRAGLQPVLEAHLVADHVAQRRVEFLGDALGHAGWRRCAAAACGRSVPRRRRQAAPELEAILGSCVVLPEPVSPQTMTTGGRGSRARSRRGARRPAAIRGRRSAEPGCGARARRARASRGSRRLVHGARIIRASHARVTLAPRRCGTIAAAPAMSLVVPSHLRPLVPLGRAVHPRLPRQDLRGRAGRRADRGGQAQRLRAGPGDPARDGHQAGAGAWLSPAGERAAARPRDTRRASATASASPTRVALDCAQEAAGQLRFEIEAAFSQGPAQHADGQRHRARGVGQLPHRAAGRHRRRRRLHAQRRRAPSRRRDHPARHRQRRASCCCRRSAFRPPAKPST